MKKYWVNYNHSGKLNWHLVILFSLWVMCFWPRLGLAQISSVNLYRSNYAINNSVQEAKAFITQKYPELTQGNSAIYCAYIRISPNATYYTFFQTYNAILIENAVVKVSITNSNNLQYTSGNYYNTTDWPEVVIPQISASNLNKVSNQYKFPASVTGKPMITVNQSNEPEGVMVYDFQFEDHSGRLSVFLNENGDAIKTLSHQLFFSEVDTVVSAKAFLPDPLTSAGVTYGGDYVDNNDADNDALNNEAVEIELQVKLEDGVFYLRNDSVIIKDINTPTVPVATSTTPTFYFTRSESGFEDVNVFYHITNFNKDILALGYESLQNFYIEIDPHGASGADQSFYVSAAIPTIQFGEGGVDDAEDADVIIHEYTHAISDQASPGSVSGLERRALDEGYGDYFAASYSRKFSDFEWAKIFSWDGHNEFWLGRNADSNKHYPENNSDNYYSSSEIWSGALMDIFDFIGKENTDKLVLETMFGSFPNMTMPDAAQIMLISEATLFGGTYYETVYNALEARGLLNPLDININANLNSINILNTAGFSFNNEALIIQLPNVETFTFNCYTIDGRLLTTITGNAQQFEWKAPENFANLLFVEVITNSAKIGRVLINNEH